MMQKTFERAFRSLKTKAGSLRNYLFPTFSEAELVLRLLSRTRNHGCMIDVGAHFGESLGPYEKLGWNIFAFEPDPANHAAIKPQRPSTRLFDLAVSDKDNERIPFYTSEESSGISGLHPFHPTHKSGTMVTTISLRTFCQEHGIQAVDFLKIDTEGYDLFVLEGFPFESCKPDVILCEFEDLKTLSLGYSFHDLGQFLIRQGYLVYLSEWYPIVRYGVKHRWKHIRPYPASLDDPAGWGNFIALRPALQTAFERVLETYIRRTSRNMPAR